MKSSGTVTHYLVRVLLVALNSVGRTALKLVVTLYYAVIDSSIDRLSVVDEEE